MRHFEGSDDGTDLFMVSVYMHIFFSPVTKEDHIHLCCLITIGYEYKYYCILPHLKAVCADLFYMPFM